MADPQQGDEKRRKSDCPQGAAARIAFFIA
jgi:hypothetical protein